MIGVWLFIAPWALNTTGELNSSWNAWIAGLLIVATALWALAKPESQAAEWSMLLLGFWVFVSPWALGLGAIAASAWHTMLVGAVVVAVATLAMADMPRPQSGRRHSQARQAR
ncbi:MAG: SPW repeat protein [Chloroflexales bacterium]|nr:SPW repeat protein [Chloroflexales bacterium]